MRRIVTAITAAALALSLVSQANVANAAVAGYDSAYAGESAFLNLSPGQTGTFTVFFANTGTTSWVRGTATQVDLAACLEDKVTCNAQDASEAPFNSGWLSTVRYATATQTTVAPGQIGTFTYNVAVPAATAAGTYRFNGALVLASTGADIHNEGYYQDVTVGGGTGAAVITSLTPNTGTASGGTTVTIAGSGIVCNPSFPTVNFGANTATVTSCGATALTVTSPAGAVGAVNVTVTNSGAPASNALTYTYTDTTRPVFQSFTVSGNFVTAQFSEPVCRSTAGTEATDWTVNNVSAATVNPVIDDSIPLCNTAADNGVSTVTIQLTNPVPNGSFVETTLNVAPGTATANNANIRDTAGNTASAPQSRQATATPPETTAPTVTNVSAAPNQATMVVTFSEPVWCADAREATDVQANTGSTTFTLVSDNCAAAAASATTQVTFTMSGNFTSGTSYVASFKANTSPDANEIQDVVGNDLAPTTFTFTAGQADFTPPTMIDARLTGNVGTTDFSETGDAFSVTFSEKMNGATTGTLDIQDQDGTTARITCGVNATCSWNSTTTPTTLTVTLNATLAVGVPSPPGGPGSTPGMQIPFNITALGGITDAANPGNPPNVLGSTDRLVDYE